jgi:hypothetical protein
LTWWEYQTKKGLGAVGKAFEGLGARQTIPGHVAILVYWLIGVLIGVTVNGAVDAAVVAVSCLGVTCLLGSGGIGVNGTISEVGDWGLGVENWGFELGFGLRFVLGWVDV